MAGSLMGCAEGALRQDAGDVPLIIGAAVDTARRLDHLLNPDGSRFDRFTRDGLANLERQGVAGVHWRLADAAKSEPNFRTALLFVNGHNGRDARQREIATTATPLP
jgi:hypothetical protein